MAIFHQQFLKDYSGGTLCSSSPSDEISANSIFTSTSATSTSFVRSPTSIPEFVYQLMRMLKNEAICNIIQWGPACIIVHNPVRLENELLHLYFRHSNFSSFQRQLNYFGFRKVAVKGRMNPCRFVRDDITEDLNSLLLIKVSVLVNMIS